jgi:hypothetical protein
MKFKIGKIKIGNQEGIDEIQKDEADIINDESKKINDESKQSIRKMKSDEIQKVLGEIEVIDRFEKVEEGKILNQNEKKLNFQNVANYQEEGEFLNEEINIPKQISTQIEKCLNDHFLKIYNSKIDIFKIQTKFYLFNESSIEIFQYNSSKKISIDDFNKTDFNNEDTFIFFNSLDLSFYKVGFDFSHYFNQ